MSLLKDMHLNFLSANFAVFLLAKGKPTDSLYQVIVTSYTITASYQFICRITQPWFQNILPFTDCAMTIMEIPNHLSQAIFGMTRVSATKETRKRRINFTGDIVPPSFLLDTYHYIGLDSHLCNNTRYGQVELVRANNIFYDNPLGEPPLLLTSMMWNILSTMAISAL